MNLRGHGPAVIAGLGAGLAGGLFGVGGGIVMVPVLAGRFRLTQHQAHGTSLAIVGVTALVSLFVYALHGNVAWTVAAIVALASAIAAGWGAKLATRTPAARLAQAFAVLLVVVAVRLLFPTRAIAPVTGGMALAVELAIGLGVGLLAGYMGVGGGMLAVPALSLILGMPQHLAQGTSLAVILVTAPFGAWEHHRHGNVVGRLVPPFALGAAVAGPLAAELAQHVDRMLLGRAFAVFLMGVAVQLWLRAARRARAAAAARDVA